MSQIIYSILAIMLLAVFTMNMLRGKFESQNRMVVNEAATQMSGVATGILDFVGSMPFDENTDEDKKPQPVEYPVVTSATQLTAAADFGGCIELKFENILCDDIDDFHGLEGTLEAGELPYDFEIEVRYVDPNNPTQTSSTQTFVKEVAVTVWSPYIQLGDEPMPLRMTRLFVYNRHISAP